MTTLLVTSTAEGTGKTAISIALAGLARDRGASAGYMKPKGTRLESVVGKTRDRDPALAKERLGLDADLATLEPVVYSPTFVREAIRGREDPAALRERVAEQFAALAADREVMVLEGGGRLQTGGIVELTDADVASLIDADVLLVSRYDDPTDLDDVLAAAEWLGDRLAGVLFNGVESADADDLTEDAIPFLEGRGVETVGVVPHDDDLAGVTVADLAGGIGAETVTSDAPTGGLVERFAVGAMGGDAAFERLRRSRGTAVVTGGDRPDVQAAALEAPGVECLVLTGGYSPPSTVVGTAEDRGVPVLRVRADTRTTVDRLEASLRTGRIREPRAIARVETLLAESVDVDGLLGLAGR
jgi:BioD-like phosphotransacetylase family protein